MMAIDERQIYDILGDSDDRDKSIDLNDGKKSHVLPSDEMLQRDEQTALVSNASFTDNLEAAMNKVAGALKHTRKPNTGSTPGEPAQRQVLIRASARDHDRWKQSAEVHGMALSELIRELCNNFAELTLDCQHPAEFRRTYSWSDICLKCNTRLR